MSSCSYSILAEADLYELLEYITLENMEVALLVDDSIEHTAQLLAEKPDNGRPVNSRSAHLHAFTARSYDALIHAIKEGNV